jgi:uncharacterized membrane protein HdeD (DUF308 family)
VDAREVGCTPLVGTAQQARVPLTKKGQPHMVIGLGIVLIVAGLILVLNVVDLDTSSVDTGTLGWILLLAGALAIAISLIVNQQRSRSTTVVEERRDNLPPR